MLLPKFITIFFQSILYWITFVIFKIFFRFEVRGLENVMNLPPGIIFAANHTSEWDSLLVGMALPFFKRNFLPIYYVSRQSDFYKSSGWRGIFYGGFIFKLFGAYPAYSGKHDYGYSLQHFVKVLNMKRNVCIFPEGKRSLDGKIGEAHGGVAYLAHVTGCPVVPVAIKGIFGLKLRDFFWKRPEVKVLFLSHDFIECLKPNGSNYRIISQEILNLLKN